MGIEMRKLSGKALVNRWEAALKEYGDLDSESWGLAFKAADRKGWKDYGEDDAECNARYEFESAASDFVLGELVLDFPKSTHGDARAVSVYVLPGGTTVLLLRATYELQEPTAAVFYGDDFRAMVDAAHGLLYDFSDYGNIQNMDENSELDPDSDTTYEGEAALKRAWEIRFDRAVL